MVVFISSPCVTSLLATEPKGRGAAEETSIGTLLIFFTPLPNALESSKTLGPGQPHICFCLHTRVWLLNFFWAS